MRDQEGLDHFLQNLDLDQLLGRHCSERLKSYAPDLLKLAYAILLELGLRGLATLL